jgi:malonyl-CoA decarboxylase
MPGFLENLLRAIRNRRGTDMPFLCRRLLSERGEASQTAIAEEIISVYRGMAPAQREKFFDELASEFSPDSAAIRRAATEYAEAPNAKSLSVLSAAVEPPRQELFRRINTAPGGTETLVTMREDVLAASANGNKERFDGLDADLRHLFKSWFNRGFLRLERISWQTSAIVLEKLIRYESVHEINGRSDLRRRLMADRRCFAFFHPVLIDEPIIFVEVALTRGITGNLEPLLDLDAPVLPSEKADTAIFYSINNCRRGLRGVPFGNFLIKQVVTDLAAELPNIKTYATLSPLPHFAESLRDENNPEGFTLPRMERLFAEFAKELSKAAGTRDPVEAFFHLLERPVANRAILEQPLARTGLAYLTQCRRRGKLCDPVATFHLANGARLERINPYGNLRAYGLAASHGVTVNYLYAPKELEENHEGFVQKGEIHVAGALSRELKIVEEAWRSSGESVSSPRSRESRTR